MASKKPRRRKHAIPIEDIPFSWISHRMMDSEAWQRLSCYAESCYCAIKKKYNGKNWNNLSLTYKEMKHKMSNTTFSKAMLELVAYGFLKVVRWGYLYGKCSIYALYNKWNDISHVPERLNRIEITLHRLEKIKRIPTGKGQRNQRKIINKKKDTQKRQLLRLLRLRLFEGKEFQEDKW